VRVRLLSAYDAGSHAYWRRGLQHMLPDAQWYTLTLPPRHFNWRVRGNPLHWAIDKRAELEQPADVLLATSMVDLATLRGLVPALSRLPTLLYFHENQFAYPAGSGQHGVLEAQMVSLYSALAADRLAFNSVYNRDTFLSGCEALLGRLPDYVPTGLPRLLEQRSEVLPVPLLPVVPGIGHQHSRWRSRGDAGKSPLRLVWMGRFEYDKGGESLERILGCLEQSGLHYELALVGQRFRTTPPAFSRIEQRFAHRLVQCGWLESSLAYHQLLREADLVLSTALHEFQGIAVLEAVQSGCLPVLPQRLVYPELYGVAFCYASLPGDPQAEAAAAAAKIQQLAAARAEGMVRAPQISGFSAEALAPRYRETLNSVMGAA